MATETHSKDTMNVSGHTVPPLTILMDNKNNLPTTVVPNADQSQSIVPINQTYENSKKCKHKLLYLSAIILLIFCCVTAGLEIYKITTKSHENDKFKNQETELGELKEQLRNLQKRISILEEYFEGSDRAFGTPPNITMNNDTRNISLEEEEYEEDYEDEEEEGDPVKEEDHPEVESIVAEQVSAEDESIKINHGKLMSPDQNDGDAVRNPRSTSINENGLAFIDTESKSSSEIKSIDRPEFQKKWSKKSSRYEDDLNVPVHHKQHHHKVHSNAKDRTNNEYRQPQELQSGESMTSLRSTKGSHETRIQSANPEARLFSNGNVQHKNQVKSRRRVLHPVLKTSKPSRAVRSPTHQGRFKLVAVHYKGDSTKYNSSNFNEYEGSFKIRHPSGVYHYWLQSDWINSFSPDHHFTLERGVVTVREHGLYYVYAQIYYHDDHDTNGYVIELNEIPLFQCTTTSVSAERHTKSNTCHTSGITYLNANDRIHIKDLGSRRYTLFKEEQSFFGLVRLGDLRGTSGP